MTHTLRPTIPADWPGRELSEENDRLCEQVAALLAALKEIADNTSSSYSEVHEAIVVIARAAIRAAEENTE